MHRFSFRVTLLLGFLLLAILLGAAALRGLIALEDFAVQSRRSAEAAVQVTADLQQLAERTIDLERSARQFLVLGDTALRARFDALVVESELALSRLRTRDPGFFSRSADEWGIAAKALQQSLSALDSAAALEALSTLSTLNESLAENGRRWIEQENSDLFAELEQNRVRLFSQVLASISGALVLAVVMAWWLIRPIGRLESAIEQLGQSRLDVPIIIPGPADLQSVGRRLDWLRLRLADLEANRVRILRHVSHELKTPLAALREGVSLLQEELVGPLAPDQREVANILEHNARSLQQQIEDLLNYHATVFDAARINRRRVPLHTMLEAAIDEQRLQLQSKNLRATIDCQRQQVWFDPDKVRIALANLLSNAIAYSPEGGEVRLVAGVEGNRVFIDCIDQGTGVATEDVERIFDPFVQGGRRPTGKKQGSGIGLSIVRELISAQGGRVLLVDSANGAHFRMELPNEQ